MEELVVESLFEYEGREFWWAQCSVDGCNGFVNVAANSGKCHPHTYTGVHHKIIRAIRHFIN